LLLALAEAGRRIAGELRRAAFTGRLGDTGAVNVQGERVKRMDAWANAALVRALRASGVPCVVISEELAEPLVSTTRRGPPPPGADVGYVVCLDPLDGSFNADVGGPVGTIFGIRRQGTTSRGPSTTVDPGAAALGPGTSQVAAGYILYGAATVLVYTAGQGVHGFTLDADARFRLTHADLRMPARGVTYAVNDANWPRWPAAVRGLLTWLRSPDDGGPHYALRYLGALVADFHRILLEGGIYLYPAERPPGRTAGKLRLLYEAAPLALVAEAAGGRASTGSGRVLEATGSAWHQRVPLFIGSPTEIERAESLLRRRPRRG
jgi:fructose-1,6-bisphosphatase I